MPEVVVCWQVERVCDAAASVADVRNKAPWWSHRMCIAVRFSTCTSLYSFAHVCFLFTAFSNEFQYLAWLFEVSL